MLPIPASTRAYLGSLAPPGLFYPPPDLLQSRQASTPLLPPPPLLYAFGIHSYRISILSSHDTDSALSTKSKGKHKSVEESVASGGKHMVVRLGTGGCDIMAYAEVTPTDDHEGRGKTNRVGHIPVGASDYGDKKWELRARDCRAAKFSVTRSELYSDNTATISFDYVCSSAEPFFSATHRIELSLDLRSDAGFVTGHFRNSQETIDGWISRDIGDSEGETIARRGDVWRVERCTKAPKLLSSILPTVPPPLTQRIPVFTGTPDECTKKRKGYEKNQRQRDKKKRTKLEEKKMREGERVAIDHQEITCSDGRASIGQQGSTQLQSHGNPSLAPEISPSRSLPLDRASFDNTGLSIKSTPMESTGDFTNASSPGIPLIPISRRQLRCYQRASGVELPDSDEEEEIEKEAYEAAQDNMMMGLGWDCGW